MPIDSQAPTRRPVNVLGVIMSVVFLLVASAAFRGDIFWILTSATKWIVAGAAALFGVLMLLSALPGRRRN